MGVAYLNEIIGLVCLHFLRVLRVSVPSVLNPVGRLVVAFVLTKKLASLHRPESPLSLIRMQWHSFSIHACEHSADPRTLSSLSTEARLKLGVITSPPWRTRDLLLVASLESALAKNATLTLLKSTLPKQKTLSPLQ